MCDSCKPCRDSWNSLEYSQNNGKCYAEIVAEQKNGCGQQVQKPKTGCDECDNKYCDPKARVNSCILTDVNPKVSIQEDKTFRLWGDGSIMASAPGPTSVQTTLDFSSLKRCFPLNRHMIKCVDGMINTAPVPTPFSSASPFLNWVKQDPSFNTPNFDVDSVVATDARGRYVYVAYTTTLSTTVNPKFAVQVFKLDGQTGATLWSKQITDPNSGENPSICTDACGQYVYIAYTTQLTNDIVVVGLKGSDGTTLWTLNDSGHTLFNTSSNELEPKICVDASGKNVYVAYVTDGATTDPSGPTTNTNTSTQDVVVMKIDGFAGTATWVKQNSTFNLNPTPVGSSDGKGHNQNPTICVDSTGNNVYVAYQSNVFVATGVYETNIVVFKMNGSGTVPWITHNSFNANDPTSTNNYFPSICTDAVGKSVYLSYSTTGALTGSTHAGTSTYTQYDIVVVKLNGPDGLTVWAQQNATFNNTQDAQTSSISTDALGQNVFVTYESDYGTITGGTKDGAPADVIVFILDANGKTIWTQQSTSFNTTQGDTLPTISSDASGSNIYITYSTRGVVNGGSTSDMNPIPFQGDIVVFKLSRQYSSGSGIITLQSSCPNVFNVMTTIPAVSYPTKIPFTFMINGMVN